MGGAARHVPPLPVADTPSAAAVPHGGAPLRGGPRTARPLGAAGGGRLSHRRRVRVSAGRVQRHADLPLDGVDQSRTCFQAHGDAHAPELLGILHGTRPPAGVGVSRRAGGGAGVHPDPEDHLRGAGHFGRRGDRGDGVAALQPLGARTRGGGGGGVGRGGDDAPRMAPIGSPGGVGGGPAGDSAVARPGAGVGAVAAVGRRLQQWHREVLRHPSGPQRALPALVRVGAHRPCDRGVVGRPGLPGGPCGVAGGSGSGFAGSRLAVGAGAP